MSEFPAKIKIAVTSAFNSGLRGLMNSVHGIMPDDSIVTNTIVCLFMARKDCGFSEESTRDEIVRAVNQIAEWQVSLKEQTTKLGGEEK